jgi:hypothetical protein
MRISFLELAEFELNDAFEYYQTVIDNLGYEFVKEILVVAISNLHREPEYWTSRVPKT